MEGGGAAGARRRAWLAGAGALAGGAAAFVTAAALLFTLGGGGGSAAPDWSEAAFGASLSLAAAVAALGAAYGLGRLAPATRRAIDRALAVASVAAGGALLFFALRGDDAVARLLGVGGGLPSAARSSALAVTGLVAAAAALSRVAWGVVIERLARDTPSLAAVVAGALCWLLLLPLALLPLLSAAQTASQSAAARALATFAALLFSLTGFTALWSLVHREHMARRGRVAALCSLALWAAGATLLAAAVAAANHDLAALRDGSGDRRLMVVAGGVALPLLLLALVHAGATPGHAPRKLALVAAAVFVAEPPLLEATRWLREQGSAASEGAVTHAIALPITLLIWAALSSAPRHSDGGRAYPILATFFFFGFMLPLQGLLPMLLALEAQGALALAQRIALALAVAAPPAALAVVGAWRLAGVSGGAKAALSGLRDFTARLTLAHVAAAVAALAAASSAVLLIAAAVFAPRDVAAGRALLVCYCAVPAFPAATLWLGARASHAAQRRIALTAAASGVAGLCVCALLSLALPAALLTPLVVCCTAVAALGALSGAVWAAAAALGGDALLCGTALVAALIALPGGALLPLSLFSSLAPAAALADGVGAAGLCLFAALGAASLALSTRLQSLAAQKRELRVLKQLISRLAASGVRARERDLRALFAEIGPLADAEAEQRCREALAVRRLADLLPHPTDGTRDLIIVASAPKQQRQRSQSSVIRVQPAPQPRLAALRQLLAARRQFSWSLASEPRQVALRWRLRLLLRLFCSAAQRSSHASEAGARVEALAPDALAAASRSEWLLSAAASIGQQLPFGVPLRAATALLERAGFVFPEARPTRQICAAAAHALWRVDGGSGGAASLGFGEFCVLAVEVAARAARAAPAPSQLRRGVAEAWDWRAAPPPRPQQLLQPRLPASPAARAAAALQRVRDSAPGAAEAAAKAETAAREAAAVAASEACMRESALLAELSAAELRAAEESAAERLLAAAHSRPLPPLPPLPEQAAALVACDMPRLRGLLRGRLRGFAQPGLAAREREATEDKAAAENNVKQWARLGALTHLLPLFGDAVEGDDEEPGEGDSAARVESGAQASWAECYGLIIAAALTLRPRMPPPQPVTHALAFGAVAFELVTLAAASLSAAVPWGQPAWLQAVWDALLLFASESRAQAALFWLAAALALPYPLLALQGVRAQRRASGGDAESFAMRALAWARALLAGPLLLPLVVAATRRLACDYTHSPATLFVDASVACWREWHLAEASAASLALLALCPAAAALHAPLRAAERAGDAGLGRAALAWLTQGKLLVAGAVALLSTRPSLLLAASLATAAAAAATISSAAVLRALAAAVAWTALSGLLLVAAGSRLAALATLGSGLALGGALAVVLRSSSSSFSQQQQQHAESARTHKAPRAQELALAEALLREGEP